MKQNTFLVSKQYFVQLTLSGLILIENDFPFEKKEHS